MARKAVQEGFEVFVSDGDAAVGAVRQVLLRELVIYVENAGDFTVPLSAVQDIHSDKVVLNRGKLEPRLNEAIRHAHDAEDPSV